MQSLSLLRIFLFSCLIVYFVIGITAKLYTFPKEEVFPIYSWSLFSKVPNTIYRYDIQILTSRGAKLPKPLLYREAKKFVPNTDDISVYITIQAWGKALRMKKYLEANKQQHVFEKLHLYPDTKYQLTQIKYNPIERWKNNTIRIIPVATFTKN